MDFRLEIPTSPTNQPDFILSSEKYSKDGIDGRLRRGQWRVIYLSDGNHPTHLGEIGRFSQRPCDMQPPMGALGGKLPKAYILARKFTVWFDAVVWSFDFLSPFVFRFIFHYSAFGFSLVTSPWISQRASQIKKTIVMLSVVVQEI